MPADRPSLPPRYRFVPAGSGAAAGSASGLPRPAANRSLHVLVEEPDDFLGVSAEPGVAVLEPPRRVLDPDQFFLLASQEIKSLLAVLGLRPNVFANLPHQDGH